MSLFGTAYVSHSPCGQTPVEKVGFSEPPLRSQVTVPVPVYPAAHVYPHVFPSLPVQVVLPAVV